MSDEKALLAAIWEHPNEDTPRLVYADWLQENGQPERGEFIRVQIEHTRLDMHDPRRSTLDERAKQLFIQHAREWQRETPGFIRRLRNPLNYDRGFPQPERELHIQMFPKMNSHEWTAAPLWKLALTIRTPSHRALIPEVMNHPSLLKMGEVALRFWSHSGGRNWEPEDAVQLVRSPYSRNVTKLFFNQNAVGPELVAALDPAFLPHLTHLSLNTTRLTAESLILLSKSPVAARLQSLDIFGNPLGDAGMQTLASLPPFPELRALRMGASAISADGLTTLAKWPGLANLFSLDLGGYQQGWYWSQEFTDSIAQAFVDSPYLGRLKSLVYPEADESSRETVQAILRERFQEAHAG